MKSLKEFSLVGNDSRGVETADVVGKSRLEIVMQQHISGKMLIEKQDGSSK